MRYRFYLGSSASVEANPDVSTNTVVTRAALSAERKRRPMREVVPLVNTKTVADGSDENVDFRVPFWATGMILFVNVTAMSGSSETFDLKVQHAFPPSNSFKDVVGASIVQLTAAANILLTIDPRITAAANVQVACALSTAMRLVIATGFGGADESYTYAVTAEFYS